MVSSVLSAAAILGLAASVVARPQAVPSQPPRQAPTAKNVTTIHHFPNGIWLENMALRSNGGALLTSLYDSRIYYIDPANPNNPLVTTQFNTTPKSGFTGIAEMQKDIFYFARSGIDTNYNDVPGSGQLWQLNVTNYPSTAARTKFIANITGSGLLNGLATLPATNKVLIADSYKGVVWRVDVGTGAVDVGVNSSVLAVPPASARCGDYAFGIDGCRVNTQRGLLYYTNLGSCTYGKIPIDANGSQNGSPTVLFTNFDVGGDDFQIQNVNGDGAFITNSKANTLVYVNGKDNNYSNITSIAGPLAVVYGRQQSDYTSLYISSSGGDAAYLNQTAMKPNVGGSLQRIDLYDSTGYNGTSYTTRGRSM